MFEVDLDAEEYAEFPTDASPDEVVAAIVLECFPDATPTELAEAVQILNATTLDAARAGKVPSMGTVYEAAGKLEVVFPLKDSRRRDLDGCSPLR
ncbi:hypothetical protein GCM10020229_13250 [Kitasatospora albolonga]|uniref:hypothetical protein n=1 Tax=Kitasatospora albolonga TaxID=68173 RepID=UPI0031EB18CA